MDTAKVKFRNTADKVSTAFKNCDLTCLVDVLDEYDKNVEQHYKEYTETQRIWEELKRNIKRS